MLYLHNTLFTYPQTDITHTHRKINPKFISMYTAEIFIAYVQSIDKSIDWGFPVTGESIITNHRIVNNFLVFIFLLINLLFSKKKFIPLVFNILNWNLFYMCVII